MVGVLRVYACIVLPLFSQQVACCISIGLNYCTIVSKTEGTTYDHKGGLTCQRTQTIEQERTHSQEFPQVKATAKIKALKNTIRERTKNLTTHISHYCKTKLPDLKATRGRMYFDFADSFLYCQTNKVNLLG